MEYLFSLFSRWNWKFFGITFLTAFLIVALGLGFQVLLRPDMTNFPDTTPTTSPSPSIIPQPTASISSNPSPSPIVTPSPSPILDQQQPDSKVVPQPESASQPSPVPTPSPTPNIIPEQLTPSPTTSFTVTPYLGHLPYQEADPQRLVQVAIYYERPEYIDWEAAEAFNRMKADAQANGVNIILASGFRPISVQEELFQKQIQRKGSVEAAARLSAPPGHSEHHTGYAVDLGDGNSPLTDFKYEFDSTEAYHWLADHAYEYGFELSFPPNNLQGVSYEPWHWRFVGSPKAQEVFRAAMILNGRRNTSAPTG